MRILTFNWHEAYICTLAKTGHDFEIVERFKGGSPLWFYETRPLPPNASIVRLATARERARERRYDAIVCHNVPDLLWAREMPVPKILVFHNMLRTELGLGGQAHDAEAYRNELRALIDSTPGLRLVFISETKRADWDLPGDVVMPGIDLGDYGGYAGDVARVLRVGNFMRRRDLMLGLSAQLEILGDQPSTLLGLNEPEDGGRFTRSWDDLKACYRSHRLYLNTTVDGYEDGYNLAMLEAMATGMPVVSTANRTSPILDGVNGFVSSDLAKLGRRVHELLADRDLAVNLGREARATVQAAFPMDGFVRKWNAMFSEVAGRPEGPRPNLRKASPRAWEPAEVASPRNSSPARKKILMAYVSYPATTARYLEAALCRIHGVVTTGPAIDEGIIRAWKLQNMNEPVVPHDLPSGYAVDLQALVGSLGRRWQPDLFLWVESVHGHFPANIPQLDCPTACYLIDTHLNLSWHLDWAGRFDWIFLAQREYVETFRRAGLSRVVWLPLACDPEIHGRQEADPRYDIGFVGSLTEHHARRKRLLDRLSRRFDVRVERSFLKEMARTFSASRIVFNDAVRNDLNMRVFEALASGAMLLTDRAPGSGLDEMFVDREHLVIYDDDDLEELAEYYLSHPDEREAIAARGREEVLRWHTYDHRADALVRRVFETRVAGEAEGLSATDLDDPALVRAVALAGARRVDEAIEWIELASRQRELGPRELYCLERVKADCQDHLGDSEQADAILLAALSNLPAVYKTDLIARL